MNPFEAPFALFAFLGIVACIPIAMHYIAQTQSLPLTVEFLTNLALVAIVSMTLVSHIQPGG